jgi:hypothetical protein
MFPAAVDDPCELTRARTLNKVVDIDRLPFHGGAQQMRVVTRQQHGLARTLRSVLRS